MFKKLQDDYQVITSDSENRRRGLNFVSAWHTTSAFWAVLCPNILGTIVCVIWPAVARWKYGADLQTSVQTGFAVGGYIVTAGAIMVALVTYAGTIHDKALQDNMHGETIKVGDNPENSKKSPSDFWRMIFEGYRKAKSQEKNQGTGSTRNSSARSTEVGAEMIPTTTSVLPPGSPIVHASGSSSQDGAQTQPQVEAEALTGLRPVGLASGQPNKKQTSVQFSKDAEIKPIPRTRPDDLEAQDGTPGPAHTRAERDIAEP